MLSRRFFSSDWARAVLPSARAAKSPTMSAASTRIAAFAVQVVVSTTAVIPRMADSAYKIATVCFWENPISISLWWKWPRSACIGDLPDATRRTIASTVSKIGSPRIKNGTAKETTV